jgi:hypothetical protein
MDDSAFKQALSTYRTQGFVKVTSAPYVSGLADVTVDMYVSLGGAAAYETVDPTSEAVPSPIPEGTIIIREVHDRQTGAVIEVTAVAQGPSGVNPSVGNLWFADANPKGNILTDANGNPQLGALPGCGSCHQSTRSKQDYLFGVPFTSRSTASPP